MQEYRAGTDPLDNQSYLRIENIALGGISNPVSLRFFAVSNKTYAIQHCAEADARIWSGLVDILASPTNRVMEITDSNGPPLNARRFYRLVTPRVP